MVESGRRRMRAQAGRAATRHRPSDAPSRFIHVTPYDDGLVLVVNPADDRLFVQWAQRMVGEIVVDPAELQTLLRERYPAAVVRRRELADERAEVWYVYRDGHWVARTAPRAVSRAG